ncbi:MAG: hypothetical protein EPN30_01375 [Actinomycetota bacterium]|nr:MAG: hypothetical protein EPN30_01375 [Actinomycetota bacterium]
MEKYLAGKASIGICTLLSLTLGLSACGSSSTSNTANDSAAVKQAWTGFFSGSTSAADKISLLQNGQEFSQVINEASGLAISKTSSATVSNVVINSPTTATVSYSIDLGGKPALQNQTGTAVKVGGKWLVGDSSFCALLALEGQSVPACSSSTSTSAG